MPPICPIDRAAMIRGEDGVYRCRRQHRHEFQVIGRGAKAPVPATVHCPSNMACPACGAEMRPAPGEYGVWICTAHPGHQLRLHPRAVCQPPRKTIKDSPLLDRATGGTVPVHWLAHIGITSVLLPPPQSNAGPGDYCQPLGDIKAGGGSKSGRKRKKPKKSVPLEPWGA
jgi:hypothetical protein